ncbi:MAG: iron-containing alcohol dehydrogenase, partial [Pseudomonadota bacterium]
PALTVSLPRKLTAATGMDALAHCLEAFCAPDYHPMADGIAIEGAYLVRRWLPEAVKDGADLEARGHMLTAATMGAVAFQKGLGAIHSLSHPVGGIYDTHHGLTNAVFMPYVLAFNRPEIEERMTALGRCLDLKRPGFAGMMDWVLELRAELGIPHSAQALGIEESRLDEIARRAAADPSTPSNPRPAGVADMRAMLDAAMAGRIG